MIDTIILKASYDLMPKEVAAASALRKLARDVSQGKGLQSLKLTRFVDDIKRWDVLKFNFPVCGNLSSADLMTVYATLGGFKTYVVGNEERRRRTEVIRQVLRLEDVIFVPELDVPVERDAGTTSQQMLSFVNTQTRGFSALPSEQNGLVLEVAADQPLLYDLFRHASDLAIPGIDFAINLNAVNLMQHVVPSFIRNGYDHVYTSRGECVVFKENNVYAQTPRSQRANRYLFNTLYANRNNGAYMRWWDVVRTMGAKLPEKLLRVLLRPDNLLMHVPELVEYGVHRGDGAIASYATLCGVFNFFASCSLHRNTVHVDATNDDIFSCWDMDGLNNDYGGYKRFFDSHYSSLASVMPLPYAEALYVVDEALGRAEGVMTAARFRGYYNRFIAEINAKIHGPEYLHSIGITDEQTLATLGSMRFESEIGADLCIRSPLNASDRFEKDIGLYLREHYMPGFEEHRDTYLRGERGTITIIP